MNLNGNNFDKTMIHLDNPMPSDIARSNYVLILTTPNYFWTNIGGDKIDPGTINRVPE